MRWVYTRVTHQPPNLKNGATLHGPWLMDLCAQARPCLSPFTSLACGHHLCILLHSSPATQGCPT